MKVPILDLTAQYRAIQHDVEPKVREIFAGGGFIMGPEVDSLEKEMADYLGARHALGVSSGTDALILSLMALGIGEGTSVVTTPFTFFATAGAISRLKARPVFCDIEEEGFNLCPNKLKEIFTKNEKKADRLKIRAIIPVHLYGQCSEMDAIMDVGRANGADVIEDACQAVGSEYLSRDGVRKAGTMGLIGTLSFYPTKNLGGAGDGGMVLTHDSALYDLMRALRVHGEKTRYYHDVVGGNFRLDALQAAVLRIKLRHLDDWQKKRRENAILYDEKFEKSGLEGAGLVRTPKILINKNGLTHYHTYHQYIIRIQRRDELMSFLREREIGTSIFYPVPLHLQKCFANLGYRKGDFPLSERAAEEVLALPVYPELTESQIDWVVSSIKEFYGK